MANNIFIDFLPPWIETGIQPAFYDKESGTVLQQTARMYAKVNEVIQSVNNQNETIGDYIDQFNELHDYVEDYFDNLDVQREINNKLDDMTNDGTLARLIGVYCQPLLDAQDAEIANIRTIAENVASGSPLTASSTSDMTDTTRVYVNTSNGKWYYYDGDSWEIGGDYQSSGISNGSIDILMFNGLLKSNYYDVYSTPLDLGNAYTGFYKPDGTLTDNASFVNYHYALENGKIYTFNGENNYQCTGLVIMDGSNNVIYQSNPDVTTRANCTVTFQCKQNGLTAYISHSGSYDDTDIRAYNTMLREMTNVYNMLKYSHTIPVIQTINKAVRADRISQDKIVFFTGANSSTKMYQMNKGRTYSINYNNFSNICDLLIATNDNQIIYASSNSNIGSDVVPGTYTFTAESDGYILLTTFTQLSVEYVPSITVVNEEIDGFVQSVLANKSISYNGDSICAGAGYHGGYAKIIGDMFNMTVENIAVGGATITTNTYYGGGGARHWISDTIDEMTATYDYAILEGGVNDSSLSVPLGTISDGYNAVLDTTTYYGAFENMLKQLITRFKGKKYGYIAVHQMATNYRITNDPSTSYYWASRKCCEKWGVPFLDLNDKIPPFNFFPSDGDAGLYALRTTYTKDGDGWHPTEAGYKKYYVDKIISWLESL